MAKFTGHTITSDSALGDAKIQRSLRFDSGSSTYLSRAFASNGNRQTFTISCWVKKTHPSNRQVLVGQIDTAGSNEDGLEFDGTVIRFYSYVGGSFVFNLTTNGKFRDVGGWYHLMGVFDSTQATNSNRAKLYVNGTQLTDLATATYPSQNNTVGFLNTTTDELRIGNMKGNNHKLDGYMTEINFIDGTALDPTYFGFTDPVTGIWMPKRYEGTYGTNGFYLDFLDNTSTTTLGIDKSPNGNDWSVSGVEIVLGTHDDSMIDTPTNNFATWNAIDGEGKDNLGSFSEGNLKVQIAYQGNAEESGATLSFSSGKWYWEEYMQSSTGDASNVGVGVKSIEGIYANSGNHWIVRGGGGESDHNGSQTNVSGFSWTTGDIIGIAVDMDAGTWTASKNGTFIGANIHTNISGTVVPTMHNSNGSERHTFITNFGQDSSFAGTKTAQTNKDASGLGNFYYPVPSGYKALCSLNLPPSSSSVIRPKRHFAAILYTPNSSSLTIDALAFTPDFIWLKSRTQGYRHYFFDSVRGTGQKALSSSMDVAEGNDAGSLTSFNRGGFTFPGSSGFNDNGSGTDGVLALCWKAGGAAVSNTDGDITSSVSVNEEAGFSIATYTGTYSSGSNSATTIGHGLGKVPKCAFFKKRSDTGNWMVYHEGLGNTHNLYLNTSDTPQDDAHAFFDTSPTSSLFTFGISGFLNASGQTYVGYFWAEIPGYSKFGSYRGNGNSDGTFVYLGFKPALVIFKSTSASENWQMKNNKQLGYNDQNHTLFVNNDNTEYTTAEMDFLSNGFKLRNGGGGSNGNDETLIYMAWAEQPDTTSFDTFPNAR